MQTTLQRTLAFAFSIFFLTFLYSSSYGQTTSVTMTLQNVVQTAPNMFEYDLMLTNTGTTSLALRGYSAGINHAAGMNAAGTITHTFVSRDNVLNTIPTISASYTAASNHIRLTTTNATAGNEFILAVGVPVRIATMRITNTVNFPANFIPALNLQTVTATSKTQCIATCIVTPPGSSYIINGVANIAALGSIQGLTGVVNTPCFILNPSGNFTANTSSSTNVN